MPETKLKSPYTTVVVYERTDAERVGVMKTEEWFKGEAHVLPMFMRDGYIVARWAEYSNGENITVEGRTTIAACAALDDAMVLFKLNTRG